MCKTARHSFLFKSGIHVGILNLFLITLLQAKQPTQIDISICYHAKNI